MIHHYLKLLQVHNTIKDLEVKNVEGIAMVYYTGTITVDIKGDIGTISYSCYNHGYMGGENRLKFKTDIVNNNDIYTESRMYPPARILNASTTNISGYTYGDGEYIVSESSLLILAQDGLLFQEHHIHQVIMVIRDIMIVVQNNMSLNQ